jgi:hypothetical protein
MSHKLEGQEKTASVQRKTLRERTSHRGRVNHSNRSHARRIIIAIRKIKEMVLPSVSDTTAKDAIKLIQVDWLDRAVGLGRDRTELILVRSGPKVKDQTVKQSPFLVQTGLKLLWRKHLLINLVRN